MTNNIDKLFDTLSVEQVYSAVNRLEKLTREELKMVNISEEWNEYREGVTDVLYALSPHDNTNLSYLCWDRKLSNMWEEKERERHD